MGYGDVEAEVPDVVGALGAWTPHHLFGWVLDPAVHRVILHLAERDWVVVTRRTVINADFRRPLQQ